jgi:muramoyltetrapeptide carboxypeptidase
VIAPSGPVELDGLARGLAWLRERYTVADDPRVLGRRGYLAGDDTARAAALLEALRDPSVRAVVAGRGGYGAMRVLEVCGPALVEALARDPKPVAGFSDITALHALWARAGVCSVHGPMVAAIGRGAVTDADRDALITVLEGGTPPAWEGLEVWRAGEARGRAVGGNLALIAALHGTPYAMPMEGAVLFLEDVGEKPYRLDRMITTLRLGGALHGVRAVVLGDFTDCGPAPDGVCAEEVLRERLCDLGVPVLAGAGFGHGTRHWPIAFGREVRVTERGRVEFDPR